MSGATSILDASLKQVIMANLGALAGVQGSLVSAAQGRETRTILVTSPNRREGKTFTAVGIAYALANHANAQVLLVDANFSDPKIHECFGVPRQPGFSDFLTTKVGLEDIVHQTDSPGLLIMAQGGGATLFDVTRANTFASRLSSLREKFDYVIFDGSAIFGSSDASLVVGHFDGVVMVVECERTRWEVGQDAKERLVKAGGKILGVVLNKRQFYIPQAFYGGRSAS